MSVDYLFKRVPPQALDGLAPDELVGLLPFWGDDAFAVEAADRVIVGMADDAPLIAELLLRGAAGGPHGAAAELFADGPPDWDDDMVGTLDPAAVRQISDLLADAPLDDWVARHRSVLAAEAEARGHQHPFDDDWATHLIRNARDLTAVFRAAADHGEAVIVAISA